MQREEGKAYMNKCKNCGIFIADPVEKCPLCGSVIEQDPDCRDRRPMYPNARRVMRKSLLAERLFLFLSIVAVVGLVLANYFADNAIIEWVLVVTLILIYANLALKMSVTGRIGYQLKALALMIVAVLVLIGIDQSTGNHGWAVNFVFPALILLMDLVIMVLMIVNRRNWQSYIGMQLLMILFSLVVFVLFLTHIITFSYLALIALAVSVLLFIGTMILGGQRAQNELSRRFHI